MASLHIDITRAMHNGSTGQKPCARQQGTPPLRFQNEQRVSREALVWAPPEWQQQTIQLQCNFLKSVKSWSVAGQSAIWTVLCPLLLSTTWHHNTLSTFARQVTRQGLACPTFPSPQHGHTTRDSCQTADIFSPALLPQHHLGCAARCGPSISYNIMVCQRSPTSPLLENCSPAYGDEKRTCLYQGTVEQCRRGEDA
jgi:hypothetical protein